MKHLHTATGPPLLLGVVLTAALLFTAYSVSSASQASITIAHGSYPGFGLLYVAQDRGYFTDEGVQVTLQPFTSGKDALQSMIQGNATMATSLETPIVHSLCQGIAGYKIVSTLHTATHTTAIVSRNDRGIVHPADLKGKKVAVTKGTSGEFFLESFLKFNNLALSDISVVNTPPERMVQAFQEGSVDAIATWIPYIYLASSALGKATTRMFFSDVFTETSVLTVPDTFLQKQSRTVTNVIRALKRAERFSKEHPEEAFTSLKRRFPDVQEANLKTAWATMYPNISLNNVLLTTLKHEAQWIQENDHTCKNMPDFQQMIEPRFLREIEPTAVTVPDYPTFTP